MARRAGAIGPHGNRGNECVSKPFVDPRRYVKPSHVGGMELQPSGERNLADGGRGQLVR